MLIKNINGKKFKFSTWNQLKIRILTECNENCPYCGPEFIKNKTRSSIDSKLLSEKLDNTLHTFLIDKFPGSFGDTVVLTGGEPTLIDPNFLLPVLNKYGSYGYIFDIDSNGYDIDYYLKNCPYIKTKWHATHWENKFSIEEFKNRLLNRRVTDILVVYDDNTEENMEKLKSELNRIVDPSFFKNKIRYIYDCNQHEMEYSSDVYNKAKEYNIPLDDCKHICSELPRLYTIDIPTNKLWVCGTPYNLPIDKLPSANTSKCRDCEEIWFNLIIDEVS